MSRDLVPGEAGEGGAMSLEQLLRQAKLRMDRRELDAALALLAVALEGAPKCVPALIMTAVCHLSSRDAVQALEFARQARRWATGSRVARARALLAECAQAASEDQLEALREALRHGRLGRAVSLADEIRAARPDDVGIANVHGYVYERLAHSPSRAARARARQGDARALTPQALQKVLLWLAREELEEGAAALEAGEFVRAAGVLDRINMFDDRGAKAGYLQARAMYGSVVTDVARPEPTGLATATENLRRAATLAERAAGSPQYANVARRLLARIDKLAQRVSGERLVRPVVAQFRTLEEKYLGRSITYFEAAALRRSLAGLRIKVEAAQGRCTPGSVEARKLASLHLAIVHLQRQVVPYV
jgi:hypothetical protein